MIYPINIKLQTKFWTNSSSGDNCHEIGTDGLTDDQKNKVTRWVVIKQTPHNIHNITTRTLLVSTLYNCRVSPFFSLIKSNWFLYPTHIWLSSLLPSIKVINWGTSYVCNSWNWEKKKKQKHWWQTLIRLLIEIKLTHSSYLQIGWRQTSRSYETIFGFSKQILFRLLLLIKLKKKT